MAAIGLEHDAASPGGDADNLGPVEDANTAPGGIGHQRVDESIAVHLAVAVAGVHRRGSAEAVEAFESPSGRAARL